VAWSNQGFTVTPIEFVDATNDQRVGVSARGGRNGTGALHVTATHVFLDTLQRAFERPTRYARSSIWMPRFAHAQRSRSRRHADGRQRPRGAGELLRSRGRFTYTAQAFDVDLRSISPGRLADRRGGCRSIVPRRTCRTADRHRHQVEHIGLGLIEGITDVVRDVAGEVRWM